MLTDNLLKGFAILCIQKVYIPGPYSSDISLTRYFTYKKLSVLTDNLLKGFAILCIQKVACPHRQPTNNLLRQLKLRLPKQRRNIIAITKAYFMLMYICLYLIYTKTYLVHQISYKNATMLMDI